MTENDSIRSRRIKIGLLVLVLLGALQYGVLPMLDWRSNIIEEIKGLQNLVAKKKSLVGKESQINQSLERIRSEAALTETYFYRDFKDVRSLQLKLQTQIEGLAEQHAVTIKSIDWIRPSEDKILQAPIKIRCEGLPEKTMAFITAIEGGQPFRSIDRLRINARETTTTLSTEITVSVYGVVKNGDTPSNGGNSGK